MKKLLGVLFILGALTTLGKEFKQVKITLPNGDIVYKSKVLGRDVLRDVNNNPARANRDYKGEFYTSSVVSEITEYWWGYIVKLSNGMELHADTPEEKNYVMDLDQGKKYRFIVDGFEQTLFKESVKVENFAPLIDEAKVEDVK